MTTGGAALLCLLMFAAALLYSSVGHAGASGPSHNDGLPRHERGGRGQWAGSHAASSTRDGRSPRATASLRARAFRTNPCR